ncbi:MAG: hypothetical protein ACYDHX_16490 [Methanothrix sp.]
MDRVFLDINVEGNYLDLNLGRNNIIKNNRFDKFTRLLESKIINDFISLIGRLDIQDGVEMNDFIRYVTKPLFSYSYIMAASKEAINKENELIKNDKFLSRFLIKYYSFKCFSKDGFSLKKYDEIKKMRIKLINCWDFNDNYISDILIKCDGFHEDYLYVMLEDHGLIDLLIKHLLGCNESINYYDIFKMISESDLKDIMPSEVNIVNIHNYTTDILITHLLEGEEGFKLFVNSENRFIALIRKYKHEIYKNNPNLLKELFRYIKWENGPDIKRVLHEQEIILNWLKDSKLIEENEFEYYRLTEDDLAGSIFG